MRALDTNILVRLLVADDAKQTRRVEALIDELDEADERAFVPDIVVCELVGVLRSAYDFDRAAISGALRQLLAAKQLTFSVAGELGRALTAYEGGGGDFSDYLIREQARTAGCEAVVTFDKRLLDDAMFVAP